ncbi:MAG: hypothetical protein LUI06_06295 [Ruminococcus sp.]|nr:hypothetical protein [Ruminococcus sp.]
MKCVLYLKLMYKNNKSEFLLLFILQIIICLVVDFTYAKLKSSNYEIDSYNGDMKTFVINLDTPLMVKDLKESLEDINEPMEYVYAIINEENERTEFCTYLVGEEESVISSAKDFSLDDDFSYSEWKNQNSVLLAVENLYSYNKEEKSVSIGGKDFNVLGMSDSYLEKYSIVPFEASEDLYSQRVEISFKNQLSAEEIVSIHYELYGLYGGSIDDPIERNYAFEESFNNSAILLYVIVISALITEGYLLMYILKKCEREFSIFMMIGCTFSKNMLNIYLSIMIMLGSQIVLGDLFYMFILKNLMRVSDPLTWAFSDIKCILFSFVIIPVMSVIMIPIFTKYKKYKNNVYLGFSKFE